MNEILLATQIYVLSMVNTPCRATISGWTLNGCIDITNKVIYIEEKLSKEDQYIVLYHEQGHNIMSSRWKVPVNLFKDEEERADYFAWWILGKKQGIQYTEKEVNRYFSEKCDKGCVKTILSIKL